VRIKDRFRFPTDGGWADTLINFYFADDPSLHVCEIQLVHQQMMTVRKEQGAHTAYGADFPCFVFFGTARDLSFAACCVLRAACCVLRAACCVLRAASL
jgi:hypothetical protein